MAHGPGPSALQRGSGLGFRVQALGFRVEGLGFERAGVQEGPQGPEALKSRFLDFPTLNLKP